MSFWDTAKRVGLGIATGGISEAGGARPLLDAAAGNDYAKNLLFGGNATKNIDTQPQQYDSAIGQLNQMAQGAQGRAAPVAQAAQLGAPYQMQAAQMQGTQLNPGQMDQSRAGILGVANRLGGIAAGTQLGAGEMAVNRQLGAAQSAQIGAARAAHGAQGALAYRNAMRNSADLGLQGAGLAAGAQQQDQANANAQLGQLYGGLYGQDANVAAQNAQLGQQTGMTNAGFAQQAGMQNAQLGQQAMLQQGAFNQQTNLANQSAALQQRQMNDAMQIQALGQQLGWDQARINAEIQKAQIAAGDKGILPGLIGAAGTAAMMYATGGASGAAGAAGALGGGGAAAPGVPITSPAQLDPLAPYRRPEF